MSSSISLAKDAEASDEAAPVAKGANPFATSYDGELFVFRGYLNEEIFDNLLGWAAEKKASDIRFKTDEMVMADIAGRTVPITERALTVPEMEVIVRHVYGNHGMGVLTAGIPLDPSHEVRIRGKGTMRYRINATPIRIPGGSGQLITVRTLPTVPIPLVQLNVEAEIVENLRPRNGMVLITGPTGSGKSTLMSSAIRHILEQPDANEVIVEYSKPVEYVYDGISPMISQSEIGKQIRPPEGESEFGFAVHNALRQKPTMILIGETRDYATISGAVEAAQTGHLVYTTMHTNDVPSTLRRMLQFYPGDMREGAGIDLMDVLRMVVTQLLFPRKGGGMVALREYMVFGESTRQKFMKAKPELWPAMARSMMSGGEVPSQRLSASAYEAYRRGDLTGEVFKRIVSAEQEKA